MRFEDRWMQREIGREKGSVGGGRKERERERKRESVCVGVDVCEASGARRGMHFEIDAFGVNVKLV